jgi:hypothetical protein
VRTPDIITFICQLSRNSWSLNLLEHEGPGQAYNGMALYFTCTIKITPTHMHIFQRSASIILHNSQISIQCHLCRFHITSSRVRRIVPDDSGKFVGHWCGVRWHNIRTSFYENRSCGTGRRAKKHHYMSVVFRVHFVYHVIYIFSKISLHHMVYSPPGMFPRHE